MAKSGKKSQKENGTSHHSAQEKVVVKKKSGCWLPLLLLIIFIALVIWLMSHFSIGFFGKDDNSKNSSNTASDSVGDGKTNEKKTESETDKLPEISDSGDRIIDITVTGTQYRYDNGYIDIDDFISELKNMTGSICVRITDENAYNDVMQELKDALEQEDILFTESSAN